MAGTNLGSAYVTIMPSAKGISGSISSILNGEASSAGNSAGLKIVGAVKKVIIAAGIGKAFKEALDAGGDLQQSFGGLDTIYGGAADGMKELAKEAAKAGISANTYAEQAVSFGAALKQAYGGDVTKAAEAANLAILDMADNSAKMGTDISSIQNAYQGFAKQNYTMLDNLKLGYGGTKSEMQRLILEAEKLDPTFTAIREKNEKGNEELAMSYGDIVQAIHIVQKDLGIANVAAREAKDTFTGSAQSMKAAWENLKADMALGNDITEDLQVVLQSGMNFLQNNLLPMVGNVLKSLPTFIGTFFTNAFNNLPGMVDAAVSFINGLVDGLKNNGEGLMSGVGELAHAAIEAFKNTDWIGLGKGILDLLWTGIKLVAPKIWEGIKSIAAKAAAWFKGIDWSEVGHTAVRLIGDAIGSVGSLIWDGIKSIGEKAKEKFNEVDWSTAGKDAFHAVLDGITTAATTIWEYVKELASTIASHFTDGDTDWGQVGKDILIAIGHGLGSAIAYIGEAILTIGSSAVEWFKSVDWETAGSDAVHFIIDGAQKIGTDVLLALQTIGRSAWEAFRDINWLDVGTTVIDFITTGLTSIGSFVWGALKTIGQEAWDAFVNLDWVQSGIDIINGIIEGIKQFGANIGNTIVGFATDAWNDVKDFFKIGSPSKLMQDTVGKWIPLGIAEGIEQEAGSVTKAIDDIAKDTTVHLTPDLGKYSVGGIVSGLANIVVNNYISGAENPEDWAIRMSRQLEMEMRTA